MRNYEALQQVSSSPINDEAFTDFPLICRCGWHCRHISQVAKERVSTAFLPSGPLHMLPPTALSALGLTAQADAVNEVLTAALSVDYDTGRQSPYFLYCILPRVSTACRPDCNRENICLHAR